jgi:predicted acylesterase/phospholipase RssA
LSTTSGPRAVALCFSGGGLRATFFHLGVVRLLRDADILKSVADVFSVSGGSILAAHMALHWRDYAESGPNDARFLERAGALVELGRLDVRGRIVRRATLFGWLPRFRRTRQLEARYASLLEDAELGSLPEDAPKLHLLATSMVTGGLCSFSRDGFSVHDGQSLRMFPSAGFPLARAVAASSAFPPFFPPVPVGRSDVHARESDFPYTDYLTDGGVFDNLGVHALSRAVEDSGEFDLVVISDASAGFDWRLARRWRGIVSRTSRTTDILMRRVATLEEQKWGHQSANVAVLIGNVVAECNLDSRTTWWKPQDTDTQALVKSIRTDLDQFSWIEMFSLIRHGYEVAMRTLADQRRDLLEESNWEADDPAPLGWPRRSIEDVQGFRLARRVVGVVTDMTTAQEDLMRKAQQEVARLGISYTSAEELVRERQLEESRSTEEREQREELHALREAVRAGGTRRLGVWNSGDWASWVFLLIVVFVASVIVWRLT